ncbi:IclR family transcriptional regulator [Caballeronia fortuita]|uniref:IclR family transcriptional regulator n=1 Tax=Caballeronia fortuita TaxID=1777138 RepID=A0A158AHI0_9BURK|nr:IclR family transcriptional regulator [Caballeronia fortuita]SAK57076.1 IclR family transcriptional regulator [Caballeronia fortuita]
MLLEDESNGVVKSADRVLDVIELLARWGREMSHTEIAEALDIPKSSLTKLLKNLTARGFVEFVPVTKGYRLGEALIRLSQQSTHSRSLVSCAQPALAEVTQKTLESCALNQLKGDQVEVVATVTSPQRLVSHLRLGDLAPLYAVSGGKVILAFLPDQMRSEYIKTVKMQAITPKTITVKKALLAQIETIRQTGVAYSMDEYTPGIVGVGVPVLSSSGFPLGSLNVAIPSVRYSERVGARAVTVLQAAAERVRRDYIAANEHTR